MIDNVQFEKSFLDMNMLATCLGNDVKSYLSLSLSFSQHTHMYT